LITISPEHRVADGLGVTNKDHKACGEVAFGLLIAQDFRDRRARNERERRYMAF
jgi:hypothetical protein